MLLDFESLTIANAQELHETLLSAALTDESLLELDLSRINKIDLSAIQLLLSLQKTLQNEHRELKLTKCTNSVIAAFSFCGCAKSLFKDCQ